MYHIDRRKKVLNFPRWFFIAFFAIIIVFAIYTWTAIIGPNYDYKYSEFFEEGDLLNPAIEYVGYVGSEVMSFVEGEIDESEFLKINFFKETEEDRQVTNPLEKYERVMNKTPKNIIPEEIVADDVLSEETNEEVIEDVSEEEQEEIIEEELETIVVKDEDKKEILKYILILMKAYNLHNPPFSSNTPKIEMNMEGEMFNAEVIDGEIYVDEGEIEGEDVRIYSDWGEAVVMSEGTEYVKNSFVSGRSSIEQVCETQVCFLKGYKEVYDELNE